LAGDFGDSGRHEAGRIIHPCIEAPFVQAPHDRTWFNREIFWRAGMYAAMAKQNRVAGSTGPPASSFNKSTHELQIIIFSTLESLNRAATRSISF
jgi:hypothetical protein